MDSLLTGPSAAEEGDGPPSDASRQSVIVFEGPMTLEERAAAIDEGHEVIEAGLRQAAVVALTVGEHLLAVKQTVGHGNYGKWLKAHCRIPERRAQEYTCFAKYCAAHPEKAGPLLAASFAKALRSLPVAKSAKVADLTEDDDAEVAEAIDHTPTPSLARRIASDKEKVGKACNYVWHLGMALRRAPSSNWAEHTEARDREHLERFAATIIARLTEVVQELGLDGGGSK